MPRSRRPLSSRLPGWLIAVLILAGVTGWVIVDRAGHDHTTPPRPAAEAQACTLLLTTMAELDMTRREATDFAVAHASPGTKGTLRAVLDDC